MADTPISPTSNTDISDTTSDTNQPTTGADASNPSDQSTPDQQPSTPVQQPQTDTSQPQPNAQPDQQPTGQQPNPDLSKGDPNRPTFGPNGVQVHPLVQKADILRQTAQALAGGQRYTESVDVNTGQMKRTPVAMSKGDIGMAIALEAISGALGGLSVAPGPGNLGRAAGAGAQTVMGQEQQVQQQQDAQANADFARHAQVFETNLRLHQNAQTVGRQNLETNENYVAQFKPMADQIQKDHPEIVKGLVNESDLSKYHVTKDSAIPASVVKRLDPKTGEQVVNQYGEPQWDTQYLVIDPNFKADNLLSDDDRAEAAKFRLPGFADSDGKPSNLPQSLPMKLSMALSYKSKIASLRLAEGDINDYYKTLNAHQTGSATPLWGMFPDMDHLADFIQHQEGSDKPGSRGNRNNNPGNLVADKSWSGDVDNTNLPPEQKGTGYRKYSSPEEGRQALIDQLNLDMRRSPNITPEAYFKKYDATNPVAYATAARAAAGVDVPSVTDSKNIPSVDLVAAVQKDPTLPDALAKFQPLLNATQQNYAKAIGELGAKDPQAAGKILALYGGSSMVNQYDQNKTMAAEQAKKTVDNNALLARQTQERADKNAENEDAYMADAKAIAGDPNDPGSGDMMALNQLVSQRTADRPKVYALIKKLNPNWNPQNAELKLQVWKGFADPQGKEYQQVKSFNTLFDHLGAALDASNNFHRATEYGTDINKPFNQFKEKYAGDPELAAFESKLEPAAVEYETLMGGGHALTESDKKRVDILRSPDASASVKEATLKVMGETAAYRMKETNNGFKRVFGTNAPGMISDDAVNTIRKMPEIADIIGDMDTGGTFLGSSSGRGIPGKTVNQALGRQPQLPGQRPGEVPVMSNGQVVGFTMPGKQGMRPAGQQQQQQQQQPTGQ